MKRIFLIILDSFGIGDAPDASAFGDEGANTLRSVMSDPDLHLPTLRSLGLFHIEGLPFPRPTEAPKASYGRLHECSAGKDTTVGHWEIAGLRSGKPLPTYPNGFPKELLDAFSASVGRSILCNKPYSGTEVIKDYGEEHIRSGSLIVYTSADSVFQIAAHEEIVPLEELYEDCRIARALLQGEHAVGRVIARPFIGTPGAFVRTANRLDFSLPPFGRTVLDELYDAGKDVIAVGKISDIFAGRGITKSYKTHGNTEGMRITERIAQTDFDGLCFVNLVDFDMLYGHRNDRNGYAKALTEFDTWLNGFLKTLRDNDLLILSADHGCDPCFPGTDHTREDVPLLIYQKKAFGKDLKTRFGFDFIAQTVKNFVL